MRIVDMVKPPRVIKPLNIRKQVKVAWSKVTNPKLLYARVDNNCVHGVRMLSNIKNKRAF